MSDMQIAMLIAGTCSRALRRSLCDHLLVCDRCREIFAEAVKAERQDTSIPCAGEDPPDTTVARENALVEEVLEGISGALRPTVGRGSLRRIIPLWFREAEGAEPMLAAKEPAASIESEAEGGAPLAVCGSQDDRFEVRFYRAGAEGGYRAVVRHPYDPGKVPVRLAFPSLDLSFPLDAEGRTGVLALEGILLESCRIDIEVEEPGGEAGPSEG